ncbi:MAG TPA: TetR/AcrR family transcriptional regulator [Ohtaekwangia sp.]|uniref:TetR/AcrR family transcriptional regulator n=1 Tax=Ohtaekwangia sp. TaxID=2066019 RepID=UPI002F945F58
MTIASRKERQKEELRSRILQAAKELFIERGFEDTSIRNIAERIEYSPTTIYLYFKDKDDIFRALHLEGFILLNQYFRALEHVQDPFERLKAVCKTYINFARENGEFYDLMFINRSPINAITKDESKWEEGQRAFGFLVNTVQQCIDKGYFEGMDAEVLSFTLWSMVHGICSLKIRNRCDDVVTEATRIDLDKKAADIIVQILDRMHSKKIQ